MADDRNTVKGPGKTDENQAGRQSAGRDTSKAGSRKPGDDEDAGMQNRAPDRAGSDSSCGCGSEDAKKKENASNAGRGQPGR